MPSQQSSGRKAPNLEAFISHCSSSCSTMAPHWPVLTSTSMACYKLSGLNPFKLLKALCSLWSTKNPSFRTTIWVTAVLISAMLYRYLHRAEIEKFGAFREEKTTIAMETLMSGIFSWSQWELQWALKLGTGFSCHFPSLAKLQLEHLVWCLEIEWQKPSHCS